MGGEAFDDEKKESGNAAMGERVCCYDYRRDLAACFRRQDVCGEKIKTAEQKKRRLLFCGIYYFVKTSTPSFVTSTMYSIWDDSPSSIVYTVNRYPHQRRSRDCLH